jgi:PqqA peptide cyclase
VNFRPYSLLAELTHQCPLHCPYCSNPLKLVSRQEELSTMEWKRVLNEASELGVLHVGFSGGEPLQRTDLAELVSAARTAGLYTNLITSGVGLTLKRAEALQQAGLDSVQISFQSDQPGLADQIAGARVHQTKLEAARIVREVGLPLTMNVVLHRANIDRLDQLIALAETVHAERLEMANAQYYGWAFRNRAGLLPTRSQLDAAEKIVQAAKERLFGKMELLFVLPDYHSTRPKPCMNGWGRTHLTVNPIGSVLPCPTAGEIKELRFDTVRDRSLDWIWKHSSAFNRFRGTDWMPEPCRSCEFREVDFGGCRCQAALLTGDAGRTDPVCSFSPEHEKLESFVQGTSNEMHQVEELAFRQNC